ncbi:MAG: cation:proton antiporter [Bacteroidales bacterium]|nr:cation:proton antiporter [Bacteroidales bacterium]MBD5219893.1 cation:proton antiporter [Bacteroidales bacterium]
MRSTSSARETRPNPARAMIAAATQALVTQPVQIFLIVLAIILFAPLLLNKLKIPHIIGMIGAGVVVGPYGFNVLDNDSSFAIFGQVGLLYLMFLAGLEIDMYHLKLNLRRGLLFGVLTLTIPLILGVLTSVYLLHVDWTTAFLLGAMYASHTLLSYPVAARFGITKAPAVLIAIVGTIIAVIGALLVLAATVNVHEEGHFNPTAILLLMLRLALWVVVLLYAYPRIVRFFFKKYSDKVLQYVFVLTLVFLAACSAQFIGLEPVLGAFFAGLLLNRYVPISSPLMNSIEFVGNALFIPYFLISVGMMINVRVLGNVQTVTVAAIMLAVALGSKWLPAYIAQKINRLDGYSRNVMFGLTAAHTAVALAVVTVGYRMNMFDERILNSTIVVILITCALAPIITSAAAPKLKVKMMEEDGDIIRHTRINNTLIAVANPLTTPPLVEMAMLMRNDRGQHNFYAIHVRNENSKQAKNTSRSSLEAARRTGATADINILTLERFDLNTVTGILNTIEEREITEVILGIHRRVTIIDSFFGHKVEQLLRSTNRMVMITRCFIPVNTITRVVVWVPRDAQYETGFSRWVRALARLTRQVGCRITFCCPGDVQPLIRGVLYAENYGIRCEFNTIDSQDDIVLMANKIADDDLFVVIGARVQSVSYRPEMAELPGFLQKYFATNNIMMIYPEQFGEAPALTSFTDPMSSDIQSAPSPLLRNIKQRLRRLMGS